MRAAITATLAILLAAIIALTFALVLALGIRTVAVESRIVALESHRVSNLDTIRQHRVQPDGTHVLCETVPLWEYVEVERGGADWELRAALEADLHAADPTFHRTHVVCDGKGDW
jgi:hypothetical protein